MDERSFQLILGSIAEQQYIFYVLTRLLVEKSVLANGELDSRYSEKDRHAYSHDLLEHLVSSGLKMPGSSPSSLPQEPASAQVEAEMDASDPKSEKKC